MCKLLLKVIRRHLSSIAGIKIKRQFSVNHNLVVLNFIIVLCLFSDFIKLVDSQCAPCEVKQEIGKKSAAKGAYEEYVFEHQVTRLEAIEALKLLNDSFFDGPTDPGCKAIDCSSKIMKYCLGQQFLNDHCYCEQSHKNEGLPFVPHTCYVGEQDSAAIKSSIGSCYRFAEIKECCCVRQLAKRWKFLSSAPKISNNSTMIILLLAFFTFLRGKLNFKIR